MTRFLVLVVLSLGVFTLAAAGGGTVFTYQGKLNQNGAAANGQFDFQFDIYDAPQNGNLLATDTHTFVDVVDGVFTVQINYFDPGVFASDTVYLETSVGPGGMGANTLLSPRTPFNKAPLAVFADVADEALMAGDQIPQLIEVGAFGNATENGDALKATVAAISDASASKPYTVLIGPGIFDVGPTGLTTQPFVALRGAGVNSTVITASGLASDSSPNNGTLILADDAVVEDLTIRSTGGSSTDAIGVLGAGQGYLLRSARIEVFSNSASNASGFAGANLSGSFDFFGKLQDVEIVVDQGSGIGGFAGTGDTDELIIEQCDITVLGSGSGIDDGGFSSTNSLILVSDTRVRVLGGGKGIGLTWPDSQVFRNVVVEVSGGGSGNSGFAGFGSGFHPVIEDSRIIVSGTDAAGIRTNTGRPTVTNSFIDSSSLGVDADWPASSSGGTIRFRGVHLEASTGFYLRSGGGVQRVYVDHSTLDVSRGVQSDSTSNGNQIRIGATQLDSILNNLIVQSGTLDALCIDTYDEDYVAVAANCEP